MVVISYTIIKSVTKVMVFCDVGNMAMVVNVARRANEKATLAEV